VPSPDTTSQDLTKFVAESSESHYVFGILPYKMMRLCLHLVARDPGFIAMVTPLVHRVVDTIHRVVTSENRRLEFEQCFVSPRDYVEVDQETLNALTP